MGKIADISHHQSTIDWSQASKELDLAIIRVQYGSTTIDRMYKEYVAGCKKFNIPFGMYAYALYLNVNDAEVEANDFLNRIDKDAKFLVVDLEEITVREVKDLIPATQRFIDICKKAGYKVGLYSGEHFFKYYDLSKINADFLWVAKYSKNKPSVPCDKWQHTSTGSVAGINGNVDLNTLTGSKPLSYFIGKEVKTVANQPLDSADGKLTRGERGPNVKQLNAWLKELAYTTKTDDFYDQYTDAAMRSFLKDQGLSEDTVYTSAIGGLLVKAIAKKAFIANAKNSVALDAIPVKNPTKFRLAKFYDTDDLTLIEQFKKDGYKVIELPSEVK